MPVAAVNVREYPAESVKRQAVSDGRVRVNVFAVVVVHEFVSQRPAKGQPRNGREEEADAQRMKTLVRPAACARLSGFVDLNFGAHGGPTELAWLASRKGAPASYAFSSRFIWSTSS